jgi:hypothetical protein
LRLERCHPIKKENALHAPKKVLARKVSGNGKKRKKKRELKVVRMSAARPAPSEADKALGDAGGQRVTGFKRSRTNELSLVFDMYNDLCQGYSLDAVADRGRDERSWTSVRLRREVVVLGHGALRFELSRTPAAKGDKGRAGSKLNGTAGSQGCDSYRWAQILPRGYFLPFHEINPADTNKSNSNKKRRAVSRSGQDKWTAVSLQTPLDTSHVEVLDSQLDWTDIAFGPEAVWVRGKKYPVSTVRFRPRTVGVDDV